MSDEDRVYEIDLTKKYILRFSEPLSMQMVDNLKRAFDEWAKNDQPFLLIDRDVKLVRVESDDE